MTEVEEVQRIRLLRVQCAPLIAGHECGPVVRVAVRVWITLDRFPAVLQQAGSPPRNQGTEEENRSSESFPRALARLRPSAVRVRGILQDLHNDHSEVDSLMDRIMESSDRSEHGALFEEMKTKLLARAHAEQEVLYRPLETGQSEASRSFAHEGTNEHQILEQQLQK